MMRCLLCLFLSWPLLGVSQIYYNPKAKTDTIRSVVEDGEYLQLVDSSGHIVEDGFYKNGQLDGVWTTYSYTGFPATIHSYRTGKMNGTSMKIGIDGYVEEMSTYKNDILHGPYRLFFKGARINKEIYYQEGIENGHRKIFYADAGIHRTSR